MIKREVIIKWLDKALEQPLHAKVYIPAESKDDVKKMHRDFRKELDVLYRVDPEKAGTLLIGKIYKDKKYWVVIERVIGNPLVGFIKNPNGSLERVELDYDPERERRIELMREDGVPLEDIEDLEGPLSEYERKLILGGGD